MAADEEPATWATWEPPPSEKRKPPKPAATHKSPAIVQQAHPTRQLVQTPSQSKPRVDRQAPTRRSQGKPRASEPAVAERPQKKPRFAGEPMVAKRSQKKTRSAGQGAAERPQSKPRAGEPMVAERSQRKPRFNGQEAAERPQSKTGASEPAVAERSQKKTRLDGPDAAEGPRSNPRASKPAVAGRPRRDLRLDEQEAPERPQRNPGLDEQEAAECSQSEIGSDEQAAAEPPQSFRHDLIHQQQLDFEALGRPVEALIIKNPNKMRRARKPMPVLDEVVAAGAPLRWDSVFPKEEKSSYDSSAEAWKNIDELYPSDATTLTKKELDKLRDALARGFTMEQLASYFTKRHWEPAKNTPTYAWIHTQRAWEAVQPIEWGSLQPKLRQAVLILRVKWKLDVQEQVEGLGKTAIWLQPETFRLIARPSNRILQTLSDRFLDKSNKERISPNFSESRLYIYSPKSTVSTILAYLDDVVRSIASKAVPARHFTYEQLSEPVLKELARITNTDIQFNKASSQLHISWLADNDQGEHNTRQKSNLPSSGGTEDPADVVFRLLMRRKAEVRVHQAQILEPSRTAEGPEGVFVEYHREKRTISWGDKLEKWARYVNPIARETADRKRRPVQPFNIALSVANAKVRKGDEQAKSRVTATFGHILHKTRNIPGRILGRDRRIFSPVVPHPASLTSVAPNDNPIAQSTAIILNFSPDPAYACAFGPDVPNIRLRLPVNPDTDLSAFAFPADSTLEGVLPYPVKDVLLPDDSVDVRIIQHRLLPLDVHQQSLRKFLALSEFNLLAGRLKTPSRTRFSIPTKWLARQLRTLASKEVADVPYIFMGLEVHQVVDVEWHGYTLRYNSIEAGLSGGQRQELSLHAVPPSSDKRVITHEESRAFLRFVGEVANGKHFSWHNGHTLMKERCDEEFGWDTMDGPLDQEGVLQYPDAEEPSLSVDNAGAVAEEQGAGAEEQRAAQHTTTDAPGTDETAFCRGASQTQPPPSPLTSECVPSEEQNALPQMTSGSSDANAIASCRDASETDLPKAPVDGQASPPEEQTNVAPQMTNRPDETALDAGASGPELMPVPSVDTKLVSFQEQTSAPSPRTQRDRGVDELPLSEDPSAAQSSVYAPAGHVRHVHEAEALCRAEAPEPRAPTHHQRLVDGSKCQIMVPRAA